MTNRDLNAVAGTNCIKPGAAPQDDNGHGTNVGGIIAARNNGTDVTGVAPGTPLYAVKVLDRSGKGTLSQLLCGIDWVTSHAAALGIRVANASFSGAGANDGACGATNKDVEHRAICNSVAAGVTYVASAGNGAQGLERTVPAAYPEVLTTTAMTDTDGLAGRLGRAPACVKGEADDRYAAYSNWAATAAAQAHVVSAPGTCVASDKIGGGTSVYWGTSQAAPHVAGAVALCLGSGGVPGPCAGLTPDAVIARIRADAANAAAGTGFTGDPVSPLSGRFYGYLVRADAY
jgi:subtilisin family serine protease